MKKLSQLLMLFMVCIFFSCSENYPKRVVWAIPVYGQSLALGEEAIRITNFDSLTVVYNNRIVTERLDNEFGYFSDSKIKNWVKRLINYDHRSFELSVYGMAEYIMAHQTNIYNDTLVLSIFPGGKGATSIVSLGKGSEPYSQFLSDIKEAYGKANSRGWDFMVPAVCWMQGEDDIVWGLSADYKKDLRQFQVDLNRDIKEITKQENDVRIISYQTNCLTLSETFNSDSFNSRETYIPQSQMELIRDHEMFMASGPTYPYSFARERVHIDGLSQKKLGCLAGLSVIRLINGEKSEGLTPSNIKISEDTVIIDFNIPYPPLVIDTSLVLKSDNLGFSVISPFDRDILNHVLVVDNQAKLICNESPAGCKIRYAVNGEKEKSGYQYGPRGNIRDSQGDYEKATIQGQVIPLHNWCYQFDILP